MPFLNIYPPVTLLEFDIHYQIDKGGSPAEIPS
jgi:hypothetical protein